MGCKKLTYHETLSPLKVVCSNLNISGNSCVGSYRYGFNGMEKDDKIKGEGNSYTTEFRQYDPRVGRWLSIDPMFKNFPWQSPYVAFDNNPILNIDPKGLAAEGASGGGDKLNKLTNRKGKLESKRDNLSGIRKALVNTRIKILESRISSMTSVFPEENGSGSMTPQANVDLTGTKGGRSGEYNVPDGTIKETEVSASPELKQFGYRVPIVQNGNVEILDIGRPKLVSNASGTHYIPVWNKNNLGQPEGSPIEIDNGRVLGQNGQVLFSLPKGVSENDGFFRAGEIISTVGKKGKRTILGVADKTTIQRTFLKQLYNASGKYVSDKGIRPSNITEDVIKQNP